MTAIGHSGKDISMNSPAAAIDLESPSEKLRRGLISGVSQMALRTLGMLDRRLYDSSLYRMELADPYRALAAVQARGRILRSLTYQGWLVTGFDEVQALLHHEKMSSDLRNNTFMVRLVKSAVGSDRVLTIDDPTMLNQDPPDHTRLRKLTSRAFTHRYVQSLEPKIQGICDRLLKDVSPEGFDMVAQLTRPLPAIVIAEMLGVPEADYERFHAWSADLLALTRITRPELMRRSARATVEMDAYFAELVKKKKSDPGQDLISELIQLEEEGDSLSLDELYSLCVLLLVAGHETTTRLLGSGMLLLLQHPEQLALVREQPELIDNAIDEMLRFHPPVQFIPRLVKEAFVYQNCRLKVGQAALLSIAAANHDPLANPDPHRFDVTRQSINHVSFGYGPHLCLGMALARLEAKIVFRTMFDRFDHLKMIDAEPDWQPDFFFRGLNSLRIRGH